MITNAEREQAFRDAINRVCLDHNATIEITDDGKPYGMHNSVLRISMDAKYNENEERIADYFEFEW